VCHWSFKVAARDRVTAGPLTPLFDQLELVKSKIQWRTLARYN
jgi:hypothetical protein